MSPNEVKIEAVWEWDTSQDVKDGRPFLGFANYLSVLCASICRSSPPSDRVDKKGCGMAMGSISKGSILPTEVETHEGLILW